MTKVFDIVTSSAGTLAPTKPAPAPGSKRPDLSIGPVPA